jgi:hypothetical protein
MNRPPSRYKRTAYFRPKDQGTLRPDIKPLFGELVEWWLGGVNSKDEDFPGQQRWHTNDDRFQGLWVPDEDLEDD